MIPHIHLKIVGSYDIMPIYNETDIVRLLLAIGDSGKKFLICKREQRAASIAVYARKIVNYGLYYSKRSCPEVGRVPTPGADPLWPEQNTGRHTLWQSHHDSS
jgi:hypothetical protein